MLELDGVAYTIKTPSENTQDMLDSINSYCDANDVRNSKDELVRIEARFSSPIYLILWALGYLVTVIQNLVYSVGKAHNVQMASDDQLLNIADMANVKRGQESVTTFSATVTAMSTEDSDYQSDVNDGNCVISTSDTITYQGVVYYPAVHPSITLEPGQIGYLTFVAETSGSYSIAEGSITAFDSTIPNLKSISQHASIPGQDEESIASLRERIQRKQYSGTNIDAAMDAIRALPGVTVCNIIYNTNVQSDMSIGAEALNLPPRWAMIIIQGYNEKIGKTYLNYLTAPTVEYESDGETLDLRNIPASRVLETQIYYTHAQQKIPVLLIRPYQKDVYIRVYLGMPVTSDVEQKMRTVLATAISANLTVGQSITSAFVLSALADFSSYNIMGAMLSGDANNFSYQTHQADDVLWQIKTDNITIVQPGD